MRSVIVNWDKHVFDGEKILLPDKNELYYIVELNKEAWSVVLFFEETPRIQGYRSKGKIKFLVEDAPHHILIEGLLLDLQLGGKKIAKCNIIQEKIINLNEVIERLKLIENKKKEFRILIQEMDIRLINFSQDNLKELVSKSSEYPFLFPFVLKLDETVALNYLKEYYLIFPLENQVVYHSFLPSFLFEIKKSLGLERFIKFIEILPKEIKEHRIVKSALNEIL